MPSRWPLYDIWRYNAEDGAPKPRAIAQSVLITRPEFDPIPHPLTHGEVAYLHALRGGLSVAGAVEAGEAEDAAFEIGPLLGLLVAGQAIVDITY